MTLSHQFRDGLGADPDQQYLHTSFTRGSIAKKRAAKIAEENESQMERNHYWVLPPLMDRTPIEPKTKGKVA